MSAARADEAEARVDLAALFRIVATFGWDDLVYTHLSLRVPGEGDAFLINPFGMLFEEITASSLLKVNLEGELLAPSDYPINRAGVLLHSAIHRARADAACVVHLHTVAGTAVSVQEGGLLPLTQKAMLLDGQIAYLDYDGIALDRAEGERVVSAIGSDKNVLFLRNHGTLTVGETCADAFLRVYGLERACSMQLLAQSSGAKLVLPPPGVAAKVARQGLAPALVVGDRHAWPALLRRLDRVDPSYRR